MVQKIDFYTFWMTIWFIYRYIISRLHLILCTGALSDSDSESVVDAQQEYEPMAAVSVDMATATTIRWRSSSGRRTSRSAVST